MRFEGLNKEYDGKWVLKDFSINIPDEGSVCFFGPSGCGKTTLLRSISDRLTKEGFRTAWVFQEDRLLPWDSAAENVMLAGATREETLALLRELGLEDAASKRPHELSGGMKRRVAIARALAFGGDALVLDEPLKGLDADAKANSASLIRRIGPKLCLLVTHDREEAAMLSDSIVYVKGPPLAIV